ncbi:MAG: DOMON-like domain-containing protein [Cyanobacteria bacterium P01_E01_bin.35]
MKSPFSLVLFADNIQPKVKITGKIERHQNLLNLEYRLDGASQIIIPQIATSPTRQYNLWSHTCFEFFLGLKGSNKYWEFNLSPAEHWNVFRFDSYRQDIAEELAFVTLPFQVLLQKDVLSLNLNVNLDKIVAPEQNLEVGITTVIENREQQLSYWALSHPQKEADFHHRDSFLIDL